MNDEEEQKCIHIQFVLNESVHAFIGWVCQGHPEVMGIEVVDAHQNCRRRFASIVDATTFAQSLVPHTSPKTLAPWKVWRVLNTDTSLWKCIHFATKRHFLAEVGRSSVALAIEAFMQGEFFIPPSSFEEEATTVDAKSTLPQKTKKMFCPKNIVPSKATLIQEANTSMTITQSAQQSPESVLAILFPDEEEHVTDIYALDPETWTGEMLGKFFERSGRFSSSPFADPTLKNVSYFRRYGPGKKFEFLCHWKHPKNPHKTVKTWQKWVHMFQSHDFRQIIENKGFRMEIEQLKNYEETDDFTASQMSDPEMDDDPETWQLECSEVEKKQESQKSNPGGGPVFRYKMKRLVASKPSL